MRNPACPTESALSPNRERMAEMFNYKYLFGRVILVALFFMSVVGAKADTLQQITSSSALGGNDSLAWSQVGADGTVLAASFTGTSMMANSVTVSMGAPNGIISVACSANPCSWTGTGFTAGHSLLWTSDAGNGGSGPVTLTFTNKVSGVGALIQADLPGAFTGEIQVYNGTTLLGDYTAASNDAGDPIYLGALDQSGPNISKVVFNLSACASLCTDFGLDSININTLVSGGTVSLSPGSLTFASQALGSTSSVQLVTLTNPGPTPLNITSINASGDFTQTNTCGNSVSPATNCMISVTFSPTVTGNRVGTISITDNATGSPQSIPLSGTGSSVTITTSNSASINITSAGGSGTASLQVGSAGGFSGSVTLSCTIAYQGSGTPTDPPTCSLNPNQAQVSSGASANVTLTVNTTGNGTSMLLRPLAGGTALAAFGILVLLPRRPWRRLTLSLILGFAVAIGFTACGGPGSSPGGGQHLGTTSGNYAISVKATSGQDSANTTVLLTIQ